jgi:hypothetical protein
MTLKCSSFDRPGANQNRHSHWPRIGAHGEVVEVSCYLIGYYADWNGLTEIRSVILRFLPKHLQNVPAVRWNACQSNRYCLINFEQMLRGVAQYSRVLVLRYSTGITLRIDFFVSGSCY